MVTLVAWEQKYELGIGQFDIHHKHLVDLLNSLYDGYATEQQDDSTLRIVVSSLTYYADYHFTLEETWMKQADYPDYEDHLMQHKQFIFKLVEFNHLYRTDKDHLILEIISFLRRWLLDHILNSDSKYGAFLRR